MIYLVIARIVLSLAAVVFLLWAPRHLAVLAAALLNPTEDEPDEEVQPCDKRDI
ncbi:MAG: hypothetical protein ACLQLH_03425 [Terracidiphilus sp.]